MLSRLVPRAVYTQESLPGTKPPSLWRARLLASALFVVIVALLLAASLLPTTLPFRDRQLLAFDCDASGSLGLCDQADTVAHFFVELCGRGDVTLRIDQSLFRTGLDSDDLVATDFSVLCQSRSVSRQGITTLERIGYPYLEQDGRSILLYEAWRRGDLTVAEAREQLLGTP